MQSKHVLKSKTMWGGVLMLAAVLLAQAGIDVQPDEQASLIDHALQLADTISAIVGLILVIVGRYTATRPVHALPGGPLVLLAMIGVLLFSASGCEAAQVRRSYANLQDTYIASVRTLNTARIAGAIDDATWTGDIVPAVVLGDELLDQLETAVVQGETVTARQLIDQLRTVVARLIVNTPSKGAATDEPATDRHGRAGRAWPAGPDRRVARHADPRLVPGGAEGAAQGTGRPGEITDRIGGLSAHQIARALDPFRYPSGVAGRLRAVLTRPGQAAGWSATFPFRYPRSTLA